MVDRRGAAEAPVRCARIAAVLDLLGRWRPTLVAVDAPRRPASDGRSIRDDECAFLSARICGIRPTPAQQAIAARWAIDGYYEWIERGFALYAALEGSPWDVVECFPTASWTRWLGPRAGRSRAVWSRQALLAHGLTGLPARMGQDGRDAVGAALTAREHTLGRTETFGDLVVPLASSRRA